MRTRINGIKTGTKSAACANKVSDIITGSDEIIDCHADVPCNLAQQDRRNIASRVKRHRGATTVRMAQLLVRASLTYLDETEASKQTQNLARREYRDGPAQIRQPPPYERR